MNPGELAIAVALCLFVGMLVCLELGYRLGRYAIEKTASSHEGTGTIEAAVFALLGLLLGFTFANGISHLDRRRELIVQEANGIGTAYLRLDLLPANRQLKCVTSFASTSIFAFRFTKNCRSAGRRSRSRPSCTTAAGNLVEGDRRQSRRSHTEHSQAPSPLAE